MGAAERRSSMPAEGQPPGAGCAADSSLEHASPGLEAPGRRSRGWRPGRGPRPGPRPGAVLPVAVLPPTVLPGAVRPVAARRGAVAAVGGAVVVDLALWAALPETFARLPTAFWVMAVLALAVDARPYVVANRRASSVILPSICFTFGIVL